MIDTDKYEGHTPDGWYVDDAMDVIHPTVIHSNETDNIIAELVMANAEEWTEEDYANARLIADAPLLLAEVKRLREDIEGYKAIWNYLDPKGYAWEEEAFVALLKEYGFETGEEE